ncbi:MAG: hypothetical protein C0469_07585 [Cyanobacteria bacterium DS2.3.42]|nr:hypothetical protein [Cyanobacteria bacterium DS2.3.42]
MTYIQKDYEGAVKVACLDFPEVKESVVREALKRLINEGTIPKSPMLPENAWNNAIAMRKEIGDLKSSGAYKENVDMRFAEKVKPAQAAPGGKPATIAPAAKPTTTAPKPAKR